VIYDRRVLPPILFENVSGIFPLESVLFTIEVKSTLDRGELQAAHDAAAIIARFPHAPGVDHSPVIRVDRSIETVVSGLIAFNSDLAASSSEVDRYDSIRGIDAPAVRSLCVAGKGHWFWANEKWNSWPINEPAEELVHFSAGILNTYQRVASTRLPPDFRQYIS
jgi:hypothetical protein